MTKQTIIAAVLAFSFGWAACGYYTYSSFFRSTVNNLPQVNK